MIYKNELRIGNLLGFQEIDYVSICSIHADNTIRHTIGEKEYGCFRLNQYQPIPLTEEILLKCGFNEVGIDKRTFCSAFVLDGARVTTSNGGHIYYGKIWIQSLHQLQNLYFALTNEELNIEL